MIQSLLKANFKYELSDEEIKCMDLVFMLDKVRVGKDYSIDPTFVKSIYKDDKHQYDFEIFNHKIPDVVLRFGLAEMLGNYYMEFLVDNNYQVRSSDWKLHLLKDQVQVCEKLSSNSIW